MDIPQLCLVFAAPPSRPGVRESPFSERIRVSNPRDHRQKSPHDSAASGARALQLLDLCADWSAGALRCSEGSSPEWALGDAAYRLLDRWIQGPLGALARSASAGRPFSWGPDRGRGAWIACALVLECDRGPKSVEPLRKLSPHRKPVWKVCPLPLAETHRPELVAHDFFWL